MFRLLSSIIVLCLSLTYSMMYISLSRSIHCVYVFFLMIRRPPRSTRTTHSFPTRRSSDLLRQIHTMAAHQQGNEKQIEPEADKPNQSAATRPVQESGRFAPPPQARTEGRRAIVLPCRGPRRFRRCPEQTQGHHQAGASHCPERKSVRTGRRGRVRRDQGSP